MELFFSIIPLTIFILLCFEIGILKLLTYRSKKRCEKLLEEIRNRRLQKDL